jgi:hypothetical protein
LFGLAERAKAEALAYPEAKEALAYPEAKTDS